MLCLFIVPPVSGHFPLRRLEVFSHGSNQSIRVESFIRKSIYDAPFIRIEDSLLFTLLP